MEDDTAKTERRVAACAHDHDAMLTRMRELENAIAEIDGQLDLCFESGKDDLARNQIRKKLETERLLKYLSANHTTNEKYHNEQRALLESNQATLEGLRQKADLFAQRKSSPADAHSQFDANTWTTREISVDDDDIEIAFLREQSARKAS
jgi:hypothetical protein